MTQTLPSGSSFPHLEFLPSYNARTVAQQTANLMALYDEVQRTIDSRIAAATRDPARFREVRWLNELTSALDSARERIEPAVQRWIAETYPGHYAVGAQDMLDHLDGRPFAWTQSHAGAVGLLAIDTYDALLKPTGYTSRDVKQTVREFARSVAGEKFLTGKTAVQAGRDLTRRLADAGIFSVRYADGRVVSGGAYSNMVMRTRTAVAQNVGGINTARADGVEFFEINDGPDCGLETHEGGSAAGMVVPTEVAQLFPISHPNCVRSFLPRPDITADQVNRGDFASLIDEASAQDQAAFDEFIRREAATRGTSIVREASRFRRQERTGRTPRSARTPRRGAGTSPTIAAANRALDLARAAEPAVTADLADIVGALGGDLVGLDFRIKGQGSLERKLSQKMTTANAAGQPITATQAAAGIHDNLRYTATYSPTEYAQQAVRTVGRLRSSGYEIVRVRNTWDPGNVYRGVNMQVSTPEGYRFELQFHTPQSFDTKQKTHTLYDAIRELPADDPAFIAGSRLMQSLSDEIATPIGAVGLTF